VSGRPRFRSDLVVVEQVYRGETTFIVKDPVSHKYFRFRPVEVAIMRAFDGLRGFADLAADFAAQGLNVSAKALEGFAARLGRIGLLERSLQERTVLELERLREGRRKRRRRPLFRGEVLRMRWSVGDPDALLDRWRPHLAFCFTRGFVLFSAALLLAYLGILAANWGAFQADIAWVLDPAQWSLGKVLVFWVTGMSTVAIHELGHGVACKHYGGHVHEMGAMLVYFEPAFYCNVNDAWTFPDRKARLWVTAAGAWVQLLIASFGSIVWVLTARGTLVHEVAFAAMVVGGLFTIVANANPLLPLDGYFALGDWLEMPNLRQRGAAHAAWWVKHHVLRLDVPEPPVEPWERRTLLVYGALASAYIAMILFVVARHVHGWAQALLGAAGGVLFLLALAVALRTKIKELARLARATAREWRARLAHQPAARKWALGAGAAVLVVLLVPWPLTVRGDYVTAARQAYHLGPPDAGQVVEVYVDEGARVAAGAPVLRVRNVALEQEALAAAHERDSLVRLAVRARVAGAAGEAEALAAEVRAAVLRAGALESRIAALTLRSPAAGLVVTPRPRELAGRPVAAGATLVAVAVDGPVEARVRLAGTGATRVAPGQRASLFRADGRTTGGEVVSVAPAAEPGTGGEARVRLEEPWRAGLTGPAQVTLRRTTIGGALWWKFRGLIRPDLLL
jgi:hypothetical protein